MLSHYIELVVLYRTRIIISAIVAALIGLAFSLLLLKTNPSYTAAVTLNMQPSEEALLFNRQFLGQSQFNPATIITQTHIERILSRPVAIRTIETMLADNEDEPIESEPSFLDKTKLFLWQTWTTLNYGEYRAASEEQQLINEVLEAVDVDTVEGSYILRIEATHKYPSIAARLANTLADTYITMASEDFSSESERGAAILSARVAEQQKELEDLFVRRDALRMQYDIADLGRQAGLLLNSIEEIQARLSQNELELQLKQQELRDIADQLGRNSNNARGPIQALEEDIGVLEDTIVFRRQEIQKQSEALSLLSFRESEFANINEDIQGVRAELALARQQLSTFELGVQTQARQIQLVAPASVPLYPSSPKMLVNTITAAITAVMLTIMIAVLQDIFGTRVRTSADLIDAVGNRALPTASPSMLSTKRFLLGTRASRNQARLKRFIEVLGQHMSVESGWTSHGIMVTGYLNEKELTEVRNFIGELVRRSVYRPGANDKFHVTSIGPIHTVKDWNNVKDGPIIIVCKQDQKFDFDLSGVSEVGTNPVRKPLFMLWTD